MAESDAIPDEGKSNTVVGIVGVLVLLPMFLGMLFLNQTTLPVIGGIFVIVVAILGYSVFVSFKGVKESNPAELKRKKEFEITKSALSKQNTIDIRKFNRDQRKAKRNA